MKGKLKPQITAALKTICRFGESRHEQKRLNNGQSPSIHSVGTLDRVAHRLWPLAKWLSEKGEKDLEMLDEEMVAEYLLLRLKYHKIQGNSRHTLQTELSALGNLCRGLTEFSLLHRPNPIIYDFSEVIAEFRPLLKSMPKTTSSYKNRALPRPEEAISCLKKTKHRLMAEIQYRCGCRAEGVGAPQRSYPGSNKLLMRNFILPDGEEAIKPVPDPITKKPVYPFWTCEKGGKVAIKHCPEDLAHRIFDWLQSNPEGLTENYPTYLHGLNVAMRETGQHAKGRGTHSLRFNFAKNRYLDCIRSGMGDEQAKQYVSREMSHNRPDVTGGYLGA